MKETIAALFMLLAGVFILVWWPFGVVWSLNTLFGTGIPYNFSTWAATVVLVTMVRLTLVVRDDTKKRA